MVSHLWKRRWSALRVWFRDYLHILSGAGLALGLLLLLLGVVARFFSSLLPEDFYISFVQESGRYDICSGAVGLLLTLLAGYYFIDNLNNRRKFNKLFKTASREKFVKNRDTLEELAFLISTEHERRVQKKVRKMKLR